jgi:hypothetical protein
VQYEWLRKDVNGTIPVPEPAIVVAPGDKSLHFVVTDSWTPPSSGTEQLVFLMAGSFVVPAQGWSCSG